MLCFGADVFSTANGAYFCKLFPKTLPLIQAPATGFCTRDWAGKPVRGFVSWAGHTTFARLGRGSGTDLFLTHTPLFPMLISMTGFGQAHRETDSYTATVELRSVNSKTLDLTLRLPRFLQAHELEIRNAVAKALLRGKVNLSLDFVRPAAARATVVLNKEALVAAYHELRAIAQNLGLPTTEATLLAALRLPGVVPTAAEAREAEPAAEEVAWPELQPLLTEALAAMQQFRHDEGHTLSLEILGYVATIRQQLAAVEQHDPARVAHVRQRLQGHLAELSSHEHFNATRFEQEVLYYIEKLDIAEEKVRLAAHLAYFEQAIHQPDDAVGKKLGFLAQEIGREINTIGSKANDATVQHLVVGMKEELEKIKEQLNNIL